jgi:hypothetical protein
VKSMANIDPNAPILLVPRYFLASKLLFDFISCGSLNAYLDVLASKFDQKSIKNIVGHYKKEKEIHSIDPFLIESCINYDSRMNLIIW